MERLQWVDSRWELGSEFAWSDATSPVASSLLPHCYELFATGTAALLSLVHFLQSQCFQRSRRIYLPSFFCVEVTERLAAVCDLHWYRDLPTQPAPDFHTLCPRSGDIVLAVNFFGVRNDEPWRQWLAQHQDVVLVEDHSHDPFSTWSQKSAASYAIASLRKTLPLPDGAILWSPRQLILPPSSSPASKGADQKLSAMLLKQAYLKGAHVSKAVYRSLQIQGEQTLSTEASATASALTTNLLPCIEIVQLQQRREANTRHFLSLSASVPHPDWKPIFESWEMGATPFNSVIVCKNQEFRNALRNFLISHNIFTAIHWQQACQTSSHDSLAVELSNRILTIPTDHRYTFDDIDYVVKIMASFSLDKST